MSITPDGGSKNIRGGPGTAYPIKGTLEAGTQAQACWRNAAGDWVRLASEDNAELWIFTGIIVITGEVDDLEIVSPPPLPVISVITNFDNCGTGAGLCVNEFGGEMGSAYTPPDSVKESYPAESNHGQVARLDYDVTWWGAFWLKLQGHNISRFCKLAFDVKLDPVPPAIPPDTTGGSLKVEFKPRGANQPTVYLVRGITNYWQTMSVNFSGKTSNFTSMEELVFTLDRKGNRFNGTFFLDNIRLLGC